MVILIAGGTHTGKTALAQKVMEKYSFPYLSIDHLKMGLIRSRHTSLTAESNDVELTEYLWPVVREMIKTNIENGQNIIFEGIYIPFNYGSDFAPEYLEHIKYVCLIFSRNYIENHYADIIGNACVIEKRLEGQYPKGALIEENERNLELCRQYGLDYILIDDRYDFDIGELFSLS